VLDDITLEVSPGEIVIMTGPSGSGKTTLLSLIGALRSTQEGSLRVLGRELRGSAKGDLLEVRRRIGYIFQAHNLLDSLSARQNVEMSLVHHHDCPDQEMADRAVAMLRAVGLEAHGGKRPAQLSGGQRQRVAIARALVGEPRIVLADEPTASLDKESGRQVVQLIHDLARRNGCAVLLVTHDNRILDVADRVVHMEDGRLKSFTAAVTTDTQRMLEALARNTRKGDLVQRVQDMPLAAFSALLEQLTAESEQLLRVLSLSQSDAFESMLDQVLDAFTLKIGKLMSAEKATLFVVDASSSELWSKSISEHVEIRVPLAAGIAGFVARTGQPLNVHDAYAEPLFNRRVDEETGFRTRSVLAIPIVNATGGVFAVLQLLNKIDGQPFGEADLRLSSELTGQLGVILETWTTMRHTQRGVAT
jgi:putative ABC transport system ATP-binding protein